MNSVFAKTQNPSPALQVSLHTVFIVDADRTYDVRRYPARIGPELESTWEVFRTIAGNGIVETGLSAHVGKDSVFHAESDEITHYACKGDRWKFLWFRFSLGTIRHPSPIMDGLLDSLRRPWKVRGAELEEASAIRCIELLRDPDEISAAGASAVFTALLHKWISRTDDTTDSPASLNSRMRDAVIRMKAAENHPVNMQVLAREMGMSPRNFRSIFRNTMGIPPKRFYDESRIQTARELLRLTSDSIATIADRLGFCDQFHFSKLFKSVTGTSPSRYRREGMPG